MLSQNPALAGLTDAQRQAIATMSQNDENTVIGARIGELHGQYDADVLSVTGVTKKAGEKSYDYVKRVLGDYKSKIDEHKTTKAELRAAQAQVTDLQAKLEKNAGNETVVQQLKDAKAQVSQLQASLASKEAAFKTEKDKLEAANKSIHVDYAFQTAVAGLKFKDSIPESIKGVLLSAAKDEVLAKGTPDFVDENGSKKFVLRGADGTTLNNPKNSLNPYTMQELLQESAALKDALDSGRQQPGGGTGPNKAVPTGSSRTLDLSGIKTQLEADKAITAHLLAEGLTRDSQEFAEQSMQLRDDNEVSKLPIR